MVNLVYFCKGGAAF